ncbi:MAG: 16S rRNA (cytidine(1402)-2'-O)-methyltransferase [Bacteroidota bacterium]|jgi:16S rRNA (cytidine1402-2'-O)-methyltransferase|nr:16S rRNA (cytidine(1402)-2'-O)-methyltransferase [Bacteroidota bacterium]
MNDDRPEPRGGTLYVVATPIGNMDDITLRAIRILRDVDLIAAEDTRTTGNLLRHHGITTPTISYFSHNERQRIPLLLERLGEGQSIAVVSDAGTPGISDPAALLISAAIEAGFEIIPIPGASAALAALVASGLRIDRFHFEGFLPIKKRRRTRIAELATETRTIILYESVHRLLKTLRELSTAMGERRIAVSREITKKFEQTVRGSFSDVIAHFEAHPPKGEFVLVIEGTESSSKSDIDEAES